MNNIKRKIILVIISIICFTSLLVSQRKVIDRIVAVAGNEIILESELYYTAQQYALRLKQDPTSLQFRKDVLNEMITNKLVLAQAVIDSIDVTDDEVERAVTEEMKELIKRFGSEERLAQYANMSINKLKIERKTETKKDMIVRKMMQTKLSTLTISRREIEDYYDSIIDSLPIMPEEVEVYHIQVFPKPDEDLKKEIARLAQSILDSLRAGASFGEMAKKYSEHPSAKSGGDIPWVRRGSLVKEYEEAAFALEPGQISNVIESPLGLHIVMLVDRRGDAILTKQIFFKVSKSESDDETAQKFLLSLKERAEKGEKFLELARKYSENPETKDLSGYLGTFPLENLSPEMIEALSKMKDGDVSDPQKVVVGSNYAFQILYLEKRIPAHPLSIVDDIMKIENAVRRVKEAEELKKWVEEIKGNVYWEIRL
jgi:peptidyl-prolyl cis-trans isomerase SurA